MIRGNDVDFLCSSRSWDEQSCPNSALSEWRLMAQDFQSVESQGPAVQLRQSLQGMEVSQQRHDQQNSHYWPQHPTRWFHGIHCSMWETLARWCKIFVQGCTCNIMPEEELNLLFVGPLTPLSCHVTPHLALRLSAGGVQCYQNSKHYSHPFVHWTADEFCPWLWLCYQNCVFTQLAQTLAQPLNLFRFRQSLQPANL